MAGRNKSFGNIRNNICRRTLLSSAAFLSGASICLFGASAALAADAGQAQATLDEIVVTGSRVVRDGYEAPTPVTVMGAEDLQRSEQPSIAFTVAKLPAFSGSSNTRNSMTGISNGNVGINSLNLRSLGADRLLVLMDGMRMVPVSISAGSVDINYIPDSLVSRVDVVTGGASAAYGSDAITGVVNFILDKEYTGIKGSVSSGITMYGDDWSYATNLTAGTPFAGGRGHFLINGANVHTDGIANNPRDWIREEGWGLITNPQSTATNGIPRLLLTKQTGNSQYAMGGLIGSGPLKGIAFGPGGTTRMFQYGAINDGTTMYGGDWRDTVGARLTSVSTQLSLDGRVTRQNVFTRASYDLADNFTVFAQFAYARNHARTYGNAGFNLATIQTGNPFIPAQVQAQMTALGVTSFQMGNDMYSEWGSISPVSTRQFQGFTVGADGNFDMGETAWTWNVYLQRQISRLSMAVEGGNTNNVNYALAVDVVRHPTTGQPICRSTLTNPDNGCQPYNPMGVGMASTAAINWVSGHGPYGKAYMSQNIYQDSAGFLTSGEPFDIWAGPVSLALGANYRKEWVETLVSPLDVLRVFRGGNFSATFGQFNVTEGFVETVVPLAKDVAWAEAFDLNASVRVTHYSYSGTVATWKVGATYTPVADLRLRATRSRDIRQPNLGELFNAGSGGLSALRDPFLNNISYQVPSRTAGNPNLIPEKGDTTALGAVLQPSWFSGFSLSVDYYSIKMKDGMQSFGGQSAVDQCFATRDPAICALQERDAAGRMTLSWSRPINIATLNVEGIDFESSYSMPLADINENWDGNIRARVLANHAITLDSSQPNGSILNGVGNLGGAGTPRWSYQFILEYNSEVFSASWSGRGFTSGKLNTQYIECESACPASGQVAPYLSINSNYMPGSFTQDVNLTYHLKTDSSFEADFFINVDNITNWEPREVPFTNFSTHLYDVLGRSYRAGVRFRL